MVGDIRDECGSAVALGIAIIVGLVSLLTLMASAGAWILAHSHAASIADIAALTAARTGSCDAAHQAALMNDAKVRTCTWQGSDVVVVIQTQVSGPAAAIMVHQVEAGSRAGY